MPTAEEWLALLDKQLEARRPWVNLYEAYYNGDHNLIFSTSKWREAFGSQLSTYRDNWCDLIVDASVERLAVTGFRFGDDSEGDELAWRFWQENNLDEGSTLVHTDASTVGESYALVTPQGEGVVPLITPEHPSQVFVMTDPANSRRRLAAIKKWQDEAKFLRATIYLPDAVVKFRSEKELRGDMMPTTIRWERFDEDSPAGVEGNPMGVVPMIPFVNRRRTLGGGRSDLFTVIPRQDFVNKLGADLLVASEFSAYKQRWATGLDVPVGADGSPLPTTEYKAAVSRLWATADPDVKFGEFGASDLSNYVKAIEMQIQHIAATTRTPPHYLLGQSGAFPSGESLKATETGLVAKVRGKMTSYSESWEETERCAFLAFGDQARGTEMGTVTLWKDPESRSEGEHVDATLKLKDILPWEMLMERLGYSPPEIQRARTLKMASDMMTTLTRPADPMAALNAQAATLPEVPEV